VIILDEKEKIAREYKSLPFELSKKEEGESPEYTFEGYASVFGNIDSGKDRIVKGAFSETLEDRGKRSIKVLYQHDMTAPIGVVEEAYEDDRGLYVKGKITPTTQGKDAWLLMKDNVINEMSIGFIVKESDVIREDKGLVREIKRVDLFEVSPVTWGMNSETEITDTKSEEIEKKTFDIEEAFEDISKKINDKLDALEVKIDLMNTIDQGEEKKEEEITQVEETQEEIKLDLSELESEIKKLGGK